MKDEVGTELAMPSPFQQNSRAVVSLLDNRHGKHIPAGDDAFEGGAPSSAGAGAGSARRHGKGKARAVGWGGSGSGGGGGGGGGAAGSANGESKYSFSDATYVMPAVPADESARPTPPPPLGLLPCTGKILQIVSNSRPSSL